MRHNLVQGHVLLVKGHPTIVWQDRAPINPNWRDLTAKKQAVLQEDDDCEDGDIEFVFEQNTGALAVEILERLRRHWGRARQ